MKYCVKCRNIHFIDAIKNSIIKLDYYFRIESDSMDAASRLLLNQQLLVMIATNLEVFLKKYYASFLNTKTTKIGENLYDRYFKDCKNDFVNIGKVKELFKKDLNVDIKKLIGEDNYSTLNLLFKIRHIIVHNNAIIDKDFISQVKWKPEDIDKEINISSLDNIEYYNAFVEFTMQLTNIYNNLFMRRIVDNMNHYLDEFIRDSVIFSKKYGIEPFSKFILKQLGALPTVDTET